MADKNGHIYDFGDFRLIPNEYLLLRNGEAVLLAPKAFATLVILVKNRGHLVEKADLFANVWQDTIVEEAAVPRCIWAIRNALGDDPKCHTFIQTVPTKGYRFVAEVVESNAPFEDLEDRSRIQPSEPFRLTRIAFISLGLLSIAGIILSFSLFSSPGNRREISAAPDRGTTNEEAYRLFGQGTYAFDRRNAKSARKAVELFDQAIQLDPNFALAWAAKARAIRYSAVMSGAEDISEAYKQSLAAVERALFLDPNLSEGHSALCELKSIYEYDFAGAEVACRRAVELNPNSAIGRVIYSHFLTGRGRHSEAIKEMKSAIDLSPSSVFYQRNLGITLFCSRRYDEAARQLTRVIEMENEFESSIPWLVSTLSMQGKFDEAFEWSMRWHARRSDDEQMALLRHAYATSGWTGFLNQQLKFPETRNTLYALACLNAQAGSKENALDLLEKAYVRREWGIAVLEVDPRLDPLRGDPRFEQLLASISALGNQPSGERSTLGLR